MPCWWILLTNWFYSSSYFFTHDSESTRSKIEILNLSYQLTLNTWSWTDKAKTKQKCWHQIFSFLHLSVRCVWNIPLGWKYSFVEADTPSVRIANRISVSVRLAKVLQPGPGILGWNKLLKPLLFSVHLQQMDVFYSFLGASISFIHRTAILGKYC
jgi:hypothetical protein